MNREVQHPARPTRRNRHAHTTVGERRVRARGVTRRAAGRSVAGQQPLTLPMSITENRIQGLPDRRRHPLGNNQLRVDIRITGLQANKPARGAHPHPRAMCDNNAPITTADQRQRGCGRRHQHHGDAHRGQAGQANSASVNVHQMATGGPGVICANVTASRRQAPAGGRGSCVGTGEPCSRSVYPLDARGPRRGGSARQPRVARPARRTSAEC
jgi:hypothetical protein